MSNGLISVHTRQRCHTCENGECQCLICVKTEQITNGTPLCGLNTSKFPMLSSCRWDTILQCAHYKKPADEKGDRVC